VTIKKVASFFGRTL